jgi:hypothetical protein
MEEKRRKDLRTFGLVLGALLAFFGWRLRVKWHVSFAPALWALGAASALTAMISPPALDPVERRWLVVAKILGKINTFVILTIVYYLVLTPFALARRAFGDDPLERAWGPGSYWKKRTSGEDLTSYERQF